MMRIVGGFVLAQVIGIPLGLLLGASKTAHNLIYPVFEIMRPVPPLASGSGRGHLLAHP